MSSDSPFNESEFTGDETGQIFIAPDVVPESLGLAERTVDTQSGFVVNVKNIDGRISLSVKRHVGTPPTSSVVLTPDESLKLSKILALSSSDELTGMANYYAASNSRNNVRTNRMSNILPMSQAARIWTFSCVAAAAVLGYYSRPLIAACLRMLGVHH